MSVLKSKWLLIWTSFIAVPGMAQQGNPLPSPTRTVERATSSTEVYNKETQFKKKYEEEADKRRQAEEELAKIRAQAEKEEGKKENSTSANAIKNATNTSNNINHNSNSEGTGKTTQNKVKKKPKAKMIQGGQGDYQSGYFQENMMVVQQPLVFRVSHAVSAKENMTVVPLGSYVKARVLTGVEANDIEPYPMLLQLDYAFVGPNKTKIDLSHCFMVAKTKANLSTERVLGETQDISCVRDNGEHFKRAAKGYIAGEDSTFGMTGELISRQGQVLMTAVLASLAKGAGEAVATANTGTQIITGPGGAVGQATKITGSTAAYVAGKSVTDAASMIADWYLEHAKKLMPSIAVGSGRDIWVILLDTIQVPPLPTQFEEN